MSERPRSDRPRRLADWLNPTGAKKVHSLVDKVYKRKNLELAWTRVQRNDGAGGVDGQSLAEFEEVLDEQLERLSQELRTDTYQPLPVRRHLIPKAGQPGKSRPLGIPTIYDRVCQQALLNRLEPIFEPVFDDASFGYRKGRSTKDALRKIWKELAAGAAWIVDADRPSECVKSHRQCSLALRAGSNRPNTQLHSWRRRPLPHHRSDFRAGVR
jgi:RNA-directed DNA polymerase